MHKEVVRTYFDVSSEKLNYKAPGIQHKYQPTMVVICSVKCIKVCPWCFRKRLFRGGKQLVDDKIAKADDVIKYARSHKEVRSVLFTGGDSFLADRAYLRDMITELNKMSHITSIRFGTRAMIHRPLSFYQMMGVFDTVAPSKSIYIVLHVIKPQDVTPALQEITRKYKRFTYLAQTPLMKGINASSKTLAQMFKKLELAEIQPYYVLQCRAIDKNEKYLVPFREGYEIVEAAKRDLSGIAKRVRYVMSCDEGKMEIIRCGVGNLWLKYHQARDESKLGQCRKIDGRAVWRLHKRPLFLRKGKRGRRELVLGHA